MEGYTTAGGLDGTTACGAAAEGESEGPGEKVEEGGRLIGGQPQGVGHARQVGHEAAARDGSTAVSP